MISARNSGPARAAISAFVVCCNEQGKIRRCLESLEWCDEIVVVDSGSTDGTLEICREFTAKIVFRPWSGYVEQKRFALALCNSEWIINIDADEEVSPALRDEVLAFLKADTAGTVPPCNGLYINRVVYFLGRWWRSGGWYPEYRLRVCRRAVTSWGGRDPHERAEVPGATRRALGELYHYTYDSIADQMHRLNALSSDAARSIIQEGNRVSWLDLLLRPPARAFKFFILKRGFREGLTGLYVALMEAMQVLLKYAKVLEARGWGRKERR